MYKLVVSNDRVELWGCVFYVMYEFDAVFLLLYDFLNFGFVLITWSMYSDSL